MVGKTFLEFFKKKKIDCITASKKQLNLLNYDNLENFFKVHNPDHVYHCAAKVGGIKLNINSPFSMLNQNILIDHNLINLCIKYNVKKVLFIGSSCIYPVMNKPLKEEFLLSGKLESTVEPYAISKIAGLKLCLLANDQFNKIKTSFRCVIPNNLIGKNANYKTESSHFFQALVKKIVDAKEKKKLFVKLLGSGKPKREILDVNDLVNISSEIMKLTHNEYYKVTDNIGYINIGSGNEFTIREIAYKIKKIVKYDGKIIFENPLLDGAKRKILCLNRLNKIKLNSTIPIEDSISASVEEYLSLHAK